ncbi:hypothetical protein Q4E93_20675 [Flavitalea sp. BT771]|uniref:hypothetical protein n=1 Tax=Flavitalea sp. BT771 TaxID=3063329 RepID=UPI0026E186F7|nr:hypothetical protein [Flavitalea sp. BT771]MDO6433035.1 hypothetical protein [Flavitalea sp. BT771]MDV6221689.1 hypothetical protein [Flavitalea sp. BT771]
MQAWREPYPDRALKHEWLFFGEVQAALGCRLTVSGYPPFVRYSWKDAISALYGQNKGLLLENALFLELYRRFGNIYNQSIFYYTNGVAECDFIIYAEGATTLPIQVSWSLADPITRQRELRGLLKACEYSKVKEGWIITSDEEDEFDFEGVQVLVKPAWKWILRK